MRRIRIFFAAIAAAAAAIVAGGCATTQDGYYKALTAQLEASSRENVARYEADRARVAAIAQIAATGGDTAKTAAVLALAIQGPGASSSSSSAAIVPAIPAPRSTGETLWTAFLQVADVGLRAWGIKVGGDVAIRQSDNQAATAIASYGAFTSMGGSIERAGIAGYPYVQAPAPNITNTLTGAGVIGSGTYTGPITRTCTGGPAGNGAGTTTGAPGGAGGPATC
jgi:hypothetical protein